MTMWPKKPYIYEINTAVWLSSLSQKYDRHITLTNVPDEELDYLASLGIDGVWLMGVWYRSKAVRASALNYIDEYRSVLPDITEEDVIGSAYAIGAYVVDKRLGGRDGLASLRRRLQERGLQLILDFVPNHVAIDHAWVSQHPDRFVRGTLSDLQRNKGMFFKSRDAWGRTLVVAHGRDPYFPGWIDTAQLDAFSPSYRQAALETLLDIADQCDGVRCDMAMLLVNRIFAQTWGDYVDEPPKTEFWEDIIPNVKALHPNFIFIAEVYWDMEHELQKLGFDYTYDKVFYDRLVEQELEQLKTHLQADINYQNHT
ncbi:MAG: alpha-amylase, partial [Chloroflexi bacterium]